MTSPFGQMSSRNMANQIQSYSGACAQVVESNEYAVDSIGMAIFQEYKRREGCLEDDKWSSIT